MKLTKKQVQYLRAEPVWFKIKDLTERQFYTELSLYAGNMNVAVYDNKYIISMIGLTLQQLLDKKAPTFYFMAGLTNEMEIVH